ncbi:MAG: glycosyltransferase family 2 protein [Parachlamydiales bacterium]|nr:glycosyltransferase family 2 protein [Parachlamydiales bacterium]
MISVVILTKNSEKTIRKTLDSLRRFSEVLLFDTGSTDNTLKIAEKFSNVSIHTGSFEGFGNTRNTAAQFASKDWILSLDSDEVLSEMLVEEIFHLPLEENAVYQLPFLNFYQNKCVKCCGWYPESHIRIYNRKSTSFNQDLVHEAIIIKNLKIIALKGYIHHFSYHSTEDFLRKMQIYSSLFAHQYASKKKGSFSKAIFHALFSFFKSYFFKRGIFYGKIGCILSIYNANVCFYKYLKLEEENKKCS